MAIETERKFLVDHHIWSAYPKPFGKQYRQGYLSVDTEKTIRIWIADGEAYLTVKGATTGISRTELECKIPNDIAEEMLAHFSISEIHKIRYIIPHAGKNWEVDEFLNENAGLILAELELEHEAEIFDKPEWVLEEVTHDERYYNAYIAIHPYPTWNNP